MGTYKTLSIFLIAKYLIKENLNLNLGWDTIKHKDFLTEIIQEFKQNDIRTSVFLDPSFMKNENNQTLKHTNEDPINFTWNPTHRFYRYSIFCFKEPEKY